MAKVHKVHYERELKTYASPKGETKKSSKIPMHPRDYLWSSCSVLSTAPKVKRQYTSMFISDVAKKLGEM
jgi:hypothetical protein